MLQIHPKWCIEGADLKHIVAKNKVQHRDVCMFRLSYSVSDN